MGQWGKDIRGDLVVRLRCFVVAFALAVVLGTQSDVRAQLFGNRTLGRVTAPRGRNSLRARQSEAAQTSSGASSSAGRAGTFDPNARYVRGNRKATDFVGKDSQDVRGFVGAQQAENTGQIESAVTGLQVQTGPDANRTQPASSGPRAAMYDPRLKVDFDFTPPTPDDLNSELARRLESSLTPGRNGRIEVSVEGATAILRGEVASEHDRRLARLLLLLEPGISNVRNDLIVNPAEPTPEGSRPTEPARLPEGRP